MADFSAQFEEACINNDMGMVTFCLKNDEVKVDRNLLYNGLWYAAYYGNTKIVKLLLENKEVREEASRNENEVLTNAIENGYVGVVHLLLSIEDNVPKYLLRGLLSAAKNGNLEIVKLLLENETVRANLGDANDIFKVVFRFAVENNWEEVVGSLLKVPELKGKNLLDMLLLANKPEKETIYTMLMDAVIHHSNEVIVDALSKFGFNDEIIEKLLEDERIKARLADNNNEVLEVAVSQGTIHIIKLLLANDKLSEMAADKDNLLLQIAVQRGDADIIKLLLSLPNVSKAITTGNNLENIVRLALQKEDAETLKWLLTSSDDNIKHKIYSLMYESSFETLSKLILIDDKKERNEKYIDEIDESGMAVYNNDGYDLSTSSDPQHQEGNPLTFPRQQDISPLALALGEVAYPIGYNIHFPPKDKEIKNVIVHVYGGGNSLNRDRFAFKPDGVYDFEKSLLNEGTVVVHLNLLDLLNEEMTDQNEMNEFRSRKIHQCINQFYQTIKNSPEELDSRLSILKDKDIFLFGASFGGRTAVRHAELYPHSFTGYISHDGILSGEMAEGSDVLISHPKLQSHLDPSLEEHIRKVTDPVLLMHNMDDNNVNVLVTLDFYQKMVNNGKFDLTRLCITPVGSSLPAQGDPIHNKGHYFPENKDNHLRYVGALSNFMEKGPSALPSVTQWQAYRAEKLANKFFKKGTLQEKFVAEVLHRARLDQNESVKMRSLLSDDSVWDKHYKQMFYAMYYANQLQNDEGAFEKALKVWKENKLLTDTVIKKILTTQADLFCSYLKERYDINVSAKEIVENKEMIKVFRRSPQLIKLSLNALYQAEPKLLALHQANIENDPKLQEAEKMAKNSLKNTLTEQRKMIAHVWQEAVKSLKDDESLGKGNKNKENNKENVAPKLKNK